MLEKDYRICMDETRTGPLMLKNTQNYIVNGRNQE